MEADNHFSDGFRGENNCKDQREFWAVIEIFCITS